MGQSQLAGSSWGSHRLAVARLCFVAALDLQRNQTRYPRGWIDKTAQSVLAGWHLWISAGGVAALHHKRHRLAHNSMKCGAVVDATLNEINEIARRQWRSSAI